MRDFSDDFVNQNFDVHLLMLLQTADGQHSKILHVLCSGLFYKSMGNVRYFLNSIHFVPKLISTSYINKGYKLRDGRLFRRTVRLDTTEVSAQKHTNWTHIFLCFAIQHF